MLEPGENVGPYQIDALIGQGGMGQVYRAHDPRLERTVALKVITRGETPPNATPGSDGQSGDFSARLYREARAVARLNHPNVVAVYDVGEDRGLLYLAMEYVTGDTLRAQVATAFQGVSSLVTEVALALHVGGGDHGTWREHYQHLRTLDGFEAPAKTLSVVRHWYDFVLARRWSGLDGLRSLRAQHLDAPTAWLAASAEWLSGDELARAQMTDLAQSVLAPLQRATPRLGHLVAREMVELLAHPWSLRWDHLRCAAARDHAAVSIRQWLHAAAEERFFHEGEADATATAGEFNELGPEPSRAGKAAVEARQVAGDFLLDWFVPEREARLAVDDWARLALRTWHRLRGAVLLDVALRGARADGLRVEDGRLVEAPP